MLLVAKTTLIKMQYCLTYVRSIGQELCLLQPLDLDLALKAIIDALLLLRLQLCLLVAGGLYLEGTLVHLLGFDQNSMLGLNIV